MTRRYTLILLSMLSLSVVFNLALTWWPHTYETRTIRSLPPVSQATVVPMRGVVRDISGGKILRRTDASPGPLSGGRTRSLQPVSAMITSAEAAEFPLTPAQKVSPEEIEVLGKLRSVKDKLDERALALDAREHAIEQAEAVMKKKVVGLEAVLARVQDAIQQQQKLKNKKIKRLAAVYDSMKPAKAAPIISRMDISTVISMFAQMDARKVGKILAFLPPEKAVRISQRLVRLNAGF